MTATVKTWVEDVRNCETTSLERKTCLRKRRGVADAKITHSCIVARVGGRRGLLGLSSGYVPIFFRGPTTITSDYPK